MRKSADVLHLLLKDVSQEQATAARDGADGWNVVEIMCHLRDFDEIFFARGKRLASVMNPSLAPYDHQQLAIDNDYANQQLAEALSAFMDNRAEFIAWLKERERHEWLNVGKHPKMGKMTLLDQALQVYQHDLDHTEQIIRILKESNNV